MLNEADQGQRLIDESISAMESDQAWSTYGKKFGLLDSVGEKQKCLQADRNRLSELH